jgi:hypothetical protein
VQNHDEKLTDIVRSVLPSTARTTRERVDRLRRLLPDATTGNRRLSRSGWKAWFSRFTVRGRPRPAARPDVRGAVLALYEAGYHRELNARLKIQWLPLLAGAHDLDRFAAAADEATAAVVRRLAVEVGVVRPGPADPGQAKPAGRWGW